VETALSVTADVIDLGARRAEREEAVRAVAAAPVRFVPDTLLEALQGSWGDPVGTGEAQVLQLAR
jgi:hypothetical protein